MRFRVATLVILALLTLGYRGSAIYTTFFSPDMQSRAQFGVNYQEGTMVVERVDEDAPAFLDEQGQPVLPRKGDVVREIYDHQGRGGKVESLFDFGGLLKAVGSTEPWTAVVDRPLEEGGYERLSLRIAPGVPIERSLTDWLRDLSFTLDLPLLALAAGLFLGLMRPGDTRAFLIAIVFIGYSNIFMQPVTQFPPIFRELGLVLRTSSVYFSPYLILHFFLGFPERSPIDKRLPWLRPVLLAVTCLAWCFGVFSSFLIHYSLAGYQSFETVLAATGLGVSQVNAAWRVLAGLMLATATASLLLSTFAARTRADRRRGVIILVGLVSSMIPGVTIWLMQTSVAKNPPAWFFVMSTPLFALFPICFVYAVVRHRVFGIRLMLRRGLKYALVSKGFLVIEGALIFTVLYFTVVPLISGLISGANPTAAWIGTAAVTLGLLAGVPRVNQQVLPAIDRRFFRDAYNAQQVLTELSHTIRDFSSDPERLLRRVARQIDRALHPDQIAIFLAPEPWPGLEPLTGEEAGHWRSAMPSPGQPERFELCLHHLSEFEEDRRRLLEEVGSPVLSSRVSLSVHLNLALRHDPDVLEVFSVQRLIGSGGVPAPGTLFDGDSLRDQDLFERFGARQVIPLVTAGKLLGFIVLGEKLSLEPYTREDRDLLLTVAEQTAIALDYSLMIGKVAEQERMRRELQIAQEVQARLFPQELPPMRTLAYTGICRTAREVGGDYYDFLHLGPSRLGLALGDIAGKGISAALLMASLQALLRSHAPTLGDDLSEFAAEINRHLCDNTAASRFATFFIGTYDDETRHLDYVNAGHAPPMLLRCPLGRSTPCEIRRLEPGGAVLGVFPDEEYTAGDLQLEPGDLLLIFSDGLTEAMNDQGEPFGEERLARLAEENAALGGEELAQQLIGAVEEWTGHGAAQQDDITLIVGRVR